MQSLSFHIINSISNLILISYSLIENPFESAVKEIIFQNKCVKHWY